MRRSGGFLGGAAGAFSRRSVYIPVGGALIVSACFAAGWLAREASLKSDNGVHEVRLGGYRFINPLLECEVGDAISRPKSHRMQNIIESSVDGAKRRGLVRSVAVYYRDLNNGPLAAVNRNEMFAPASLLKLPTMIAWLKVAELDPRVLQTKFTYTDKEDANAFQTYKPTAALVPGESYALKDLLQRSMAGSDNNADNLLMKHLPFEQLMRAYTDLGIEVAEFKPGTDIITVQQYATFFRVLYNSSYLQRDFSELALWMMSQSEFKIGLVAGLPPDMAVAHKFGERWFGDISVQLHDCGIVYHPRSPYLLCIMTRGNKTDNLAAEIREISRIVFEEVDRH